jgi:hypothetical protein
MSNQKIKLDPDFDLIAQFYSNNENQQVHNTDEDEGAGYKMHQIGNIDVDVNAGYNLQGPSSAKNFNVSNKMFELSPRSAA